MAYRFVICELSHKKTSIQRWYWINSHIVRGFRSLSNFPLLSALLYIPLAVLLSTRLTYSQSETGTERGTSSSYVPTRSSQAASVRELGQALYAETRVVSVQDAEQEADPVPDPTPAMLKRVTWGFATVHIHGTYPRAGTSLEHRWNAYDEKATPNRCLNLKHAQNIAADMKLTKKNADAPQRICITMINRQLKESLKETAVEMLYSKRRE